MASTARDEKENETEGRDHLLTPEEIIAKFADASAGYQRDAVNAALTQRDAIIPRLIAVLADAHRAPEKYNSGSVHIYAFLLLGHMRAVEAHPVILELGRLSSDQSYDLYGDLITESAAMVLFRTCGGDLTGIKQLVQNRDAEPFVRSAAADALLFAVFEGVTTREEVLAFTDSVLQASIVQQDDEVFLSSMSYGMLDIWPEPLQLIIHKLFDLKHLDMSFFAPEDLDTAIAEGPEAAALRLQKSYARADLDDIHGLFESLVWGDDSADDTLPAAGEILAQRLQADQRAKREAAQALRAQRDKRKKKRKAAKASQRRNRRK